MAKSNSSGLIQRLIASLTGSGGPADPAADPAAHLGSPSIYIIVVIIIFVVVVLKRRR